MFYFITNNLRILLAKACRPIFCILFGRNKTDWIYTRYICSFFCGLFLAWLLWMFIMVNFDFSLELQYSVLAALMALMGFGFIFTASIKCITLLIFVAIVGKSGRSYLRALSFAFVIAGPIKNLSANGEEIVRVFACSTILNYNLTKTRFDLMTKPFQNTLAHMKDDIREVQHTFADMEKILEPIRNEIEGEDPADPATRLLRNALPDPELINQKYNQKFRKRCKQQLAKGQSRCREAFEKARDKCMAKFPRIVKTLLCWPFRVDFVCSINFLGDPDEICDPSEVIPNDFGVNYVNLELMERELLKNSSDVEVKYNINVQAQPKLKNAEFTAKQAMSEFTARKLVFDNIMNLMQRCLALLFIRIIIASIIYFNKYMGQIDFDNLYISEYFKHIDRRRETTGKRSILPLKKYETQNLVDLAHPCSHTKEESKVMIFHLLQFSMEVITASLFLLVDYLIVTLLQIIRLRSEISYVQEGEHTIKFHIEGAGLMARLLRSTMRNFNMHEHVSTFLTNEPCLPKPHTLQQSFYIKLVVLYCSIIVLIYKSTTFLRLRRLICGYFYRKREKHRILYLYNNLLKQRRSIFEALLKKAQANIAKRQIRRQLNLLLKLRLKCPSHFGWLRYFNMGRRKCLICDSLEEDNFIICGNGKCLVAYCRECWQDMGTVCLACDQRIKIVRIVNFTTFFEPCDYV